MPDEYDAAANLITRVQNDEPGSLALATLRDIQALPETSRANALQFLTDAEDVNAGMRLPFGERMTHADLLRHNRLPSDDASVAILKKAADRLDEEHVGASVMMRLGERDHAENKFRPKALPALKKEAKQPPSLRSDIEKAAKAAGY